MVRSVNTLGASLNSGVDVAKDTLPSLTHVLLSSSLPQADAAAEKHARKQAKKAAEKAKKAAMREKFESSGGDAAELAEAAAAAKRTPEEQAREEAKAAARAKYEAAQRAGEEKNAAMRLAADKIKNKGMTGSSLMKNRQAGKLLAGKKVRRHAGRPVPSLARGRLARERLARRFGTRTRVRARARMSARSCARRAGGECM